MKNFLSILLACSALLLISCNDSGKKIDESIPEPVEQSLASEVITAEDGSPVAATTDDGSAAATSTSKVDGSVAINPPHGQPGHRCEIAVGAPLSSAPAVVTPSDGTVLPTPEQGSTTQSIQIQQDPSSAAPSPNEPRSIMTAPATTSPGATSTAPGMNPPHGQPGHDCNVAVGAPLKK